MSAVISLDSVRKTYEMGDNSVHALDDVSLTVEQGEFVTVTDAGSIPAASTIFIIIHINIDILSIDN